MALILDRRDQLSGPGLHVFIAGVSHYEFLPDGSDVEAEKTFGLRQLSSTATTAWLVYQRLLALDGRGLLRLPIATVHLLLSPSAAEADKEPALKTVARCNRRHFVRDAKSWRTCASASDEDMTFFYFAGHGVQRRQKDSVLLLDDFGDPDAGGTLANAVDVQHLYAGMAPPSDAAAQIARRQMYFIDACRMPSGEFQQNEWMDVLPLWDVALSGPDNVIAPKFYATIPGAKAFAVGGQQTLFSLALFEALDRLGAVGPRSAGGDRRWRVTAASLRPAIETSLAAFAAKHNGEQQFTTDGALDEEPIAFFEQPPPVDVEIRIDPDAAVTLCGLEILTSKQKPFRTIDPIAPHPARLQLEPGVWGVRAVVKNPPQPPYDDFIEFLEIRLPRAEVTARVLP